MEPLPPPRGGPSPDTARLLSRVGELRSQLNALAPRTEEELTRSRAAVDAAVDASERIQVLEELLAASREREEELTANIIRESGITADLHAQLAEMVGTIARSSSAESMLDEAQLRGDAAERRADMLAGELRVRVSEEAELRERCAVLETDLRAATVQVAETASGSSRVAQLERELEASRREAEEQRRHAVASRLMVAEAEAKLEAISARVDGMQARLVALAAKTPAASGAIIDLTAEATAPKASPRADDLWG